MHEALTSLLEGIEEESDGSSLSTISGAASDYSKHDLLCQEH